MLFFLVATFEPYVLSHSHTLNIGLCCQKPGMLNVSLPRLSSSFLWHTVISIGVTNGSTQEYSGSTQEYSGSADGLKLIMLVVA